MIPFIRRYHALLVILAVYAWAIYAVISYRVAESPPGTKTLRLGHWQLETGVRDGLNEMAREYQKLHPNVRIIQDAVPESVYGQWLSTQIMGGTAPDLIQIGMIPYQVSLAFFNRYCLVLTPYVNKPNPYNANNELADMPLRNTLKDGMASTYVNELQEFMQIPLSAFATRIFYNEDLLEKVNGTGAPPATFEEFEAVCTKATTMTDPEGRPLVPIVGSKYHFGMWITGMADTLTYRLLERADFNRDGYVGNDELYAAVKSGMLSFQSPPITAYFQMMRRIADFCQSGFTGLTRDDGVLLFAQKRALFMTTGTWDARSLQEQAKGKFTVKVMNFPIPGKDNPTFGPVVAGPRYENPGVGFAFAVTRTSKHPEIALDFLLFLASKENNERLNKIIGWIPAVVNTDMDPLLKDFNPCFEGVYGNFNPNLGGETWIRWLQLTSLYQVNRDFTYQELASQFEPFYREKGYFEMKDRQRAMGINERFLTGLRGKALNDADRGEADTAASTWVKYRAQTNERQVGHEIWFTEQMKMIGDGPQETKFGPYEYRPEVLDRARENHRRRKQARQP
jgi:raffinose/stachyose/melibiose transport system substrate-binding protein